MSRKCGLTANLWFGIGFAAASDVCEAWVIWSDASSSSFFLPLGVATLVVLIMLLPTVRYQCFPRLLGIGLSPLINGSLTCATSAVRAVHTKAGRALTSLRRC